MVEFEFVQVKSFDATWIQTKGGGVLVSLNKRLPRIVASLASKIKQLVVATIDQAKYDM